MALVLQRLDHINTRPMPSALKFGGEKCIHDVERQSLAHHAGADRQDVGAKDASLNNRKSDNSPVYCNNFYIQQPNIIVFRHQSLNGDRTPTLIRGSWKQRKPERLSDSLTNNQI